MPSVASTNSTRAFAHAHSTFAWASDQEESLGLPGTAGNLHGEEFVGIDRKIIGKIHVTLGVRP